MTRHMSVIAGNLLKLITLPFRIIYRLLTSFRFWLLLFVVIFIILTVYYIWADRDTPLTTDAYVQAYVIQIAPQVAGRVVRVHVRDGDTVEVGEPLYDLDPRPFEHRVALLQARSVLVSQEIKQLEAVLAARRADHERVSAEAEYARAVYQQERAIFDQQSTTERRYLDAVQKHKAGEAAVTRSAADIRHTEEALAAKIGADHAQVAEVAAQLAEAELNLAYCRVTAPCRGTITDLQLREGAYAHVGQPVMAVIDTTDWLIVANFREKGLERMQVGQPAWIGFHGQPGRLFPAVVHSIGTGVSQGQGVPSGKLPDVPDQSTWIPPEQRFQVRLALVDPNVVALRVGMTASVTVYTDPASRLNPVTEQVHWLLAWLYYL